jgi:probable lipoprotein NlpC
MKKLPLIIMLLLLYKAYGQSGNPQTATVQGQQVDTIDYSYLKFTDLNDYYESKGVNIVSADNPDLYTPYRWGGKSKNGTDCSGFVSSMLNKLYNYNLGGAASDLYKKCDDVIPTELQEGDLLFFNINGQYMSHVGIYLQNGMFAHAAVHGGVIVSSMDEKYYQQWFYKAARVRSDQDNPAEKKVVNTTSPKPEHKPITSLFRKKKKTT